MKESQNSRMRLIVTDGVFSMDGNVAPLKVIGQLADQYKAMIFIDECHATGFFGATGRCLTHQLLLLLLSDVDEKDRERTHDGCVCF